MSAPAGTSFAYSVPIHESASFPGAKPVRISRYVFRGFLRSRLRFALGTKTLPGSAPSSHAESGGRMYARTWWTTSRLSGRTSAATTHLSSVKPVGMTRYW